MQKYYEPLVNVIDLRLMIFWLVTTHGIHSHLSLTFEKKNSKKYFSEIWQ